METKTRVESKIRSLREGYSRFCEEIEKLLGEPSSESKPQETEDAEILWQTGGGIQDPTVNLLNSLSDYYKAGFVVCSDESKSRILSYFANDPFLNLEKELAREFDRFTPFFENDSDLKPQPIELEPLLRNFGIMDLGWKNQVIYHFWINPEKNLSLVVVSDKNERTREQIHRIHLKTQALIQHRFYD